MYTNFHSKEAALLAKFFISVIIYDIVSVGVDDKLIKERQKMLVSISRCSSYLLSAVVPPLHESMINMNV